MPTRPVVTVRASPPPPCEPRQRLTEDVAHWAKVFATSLPGDPTLRRIDVATCLSAVFHALSLPPEQRPAHDIVDLLGSVHLMRAVIDLGISIPVSEFELTEDIQTAYLVALHLATSCGLLHGRVTLGLLTGREGEVELGSPVGMEAYARHLFFRPWLSDRHARAFCTAVDHAIRWREWGECNDTVRHRWCVDMLALKGYGPGARHNFYSALVLVRSSADRTPLLRALAESDLLPNDTALTAKTGPRGIELRNGLKRETVRVAALPDPEPWDESAWLRQMRSGPLSAADLERRREVYRQEVATAQERLRRLQQSLVETGLW